MEISLQNRIALVCGASQGIGYAIASQFAYSGAKVILLARNETKLNEITKTLCIKTNVKHLYVACDISNLQILEIKVKDILSQIEAIHILVNNTGGPEPGLLHNSTTEQLEKAFRQHILSAQKLIELLVPGMKENKFGRIINIVSVGMREPIENLGVSNTVRGAMGSWAKTLSRELAPFGITVNNILPGYTLTERLKSLINNRASAKGVSFEEESLSILQKIPTKRFAKPEEIAYLATFLASEYASYINGTSIPIDGGYLSSI
ncbi:MAG: SDR family oxidoreductase [Ignavibacteria bacterium]|nr:SDR family oxidoreductase [Ignavibacteria bacterium]